MRMVLFVHDFEIPHSRTFLPFSLLWFLYIQLTYSTARLGLFRIISDEMRHMSMKDKHNQGGKGGGVAPPLPLWKKAVAGLAAGGLGSLIGNPADLALIRLQVSCHSSVSLIVFTTYYLPLSRFICIYLLASVSLSVDLAHHICVYIPSCLLSVYLDSSVNVVRLPVSIRLLLYLYPSIRALLLPTCTYPLPLYTCCENIAAVSALYELDS